jgi:hypothetical protein
LHNEPILAAAAKDASWRESDLDHRRSRLLGATSSGIRRMGFSVVRIAQ